MPIVHVWDPWIRFTHWTLATLIVIDLLNEAGANPWHRYFGYAAGALVVARFAWGIVGPARARLRAMARAAGDIGPYVASMREGHTRMYVGHTPFGVWMAWLFWSLILIVAITGWMLRLDAFWGDERVETVHAYVAYVLGGAAVVHVGAAIATSALHRTNLVKAMITGRKVVTPDAVDVGR